MAMRAMRWLSLPINPDGNHGHVVSVLDLKFVIAHYSSQSLARSFSWSIKPDDRCQLPQLCCGLRREQEREHFARQIRAAA